MRRLINSHLIQSHWDGRGGCIVSRSLLRGRGGSLVQLEAKSTRLGY